MDAPLVIRFTPERKDYVRASRTLIMKSTGFVILAGVVILLMIAAAVVLIFPSIAGDDTRRVAVVVFPGAAFLILYYLTFIPLQTSRIYKSNEYMRLERKFTFMESSVIMQVGDRFSSLSWEKFKNMIAGSRLYLLTYVDENSASLFIPKSAFTTEASEEAFLALLKEKNVPVK